MSLRRPVLLVVFLFAQNSISAQSGADLHRYDPSIEAFMEKNQRDSFLFYSNEKARLARQSDSLALWGWTQLEIHDFFSENGNNEEALKVLDAAWQQRWREPKIPEEWEPFLYVQQNRGWCLFQAGRVWQAVQAYESAALLYERFRYADFEAVETIYKPLGAHYTRLGDNEKAITVFEKALLLGGDNESLAGLYTNIGIAHWNRGDFSRAAVAFRQGLGLKHVSATRRALLLSGLAQTTLDAGNAQEAYDIARQAIALLRSSPVSRQSVEYRAYARRTAGLAATSLGRYTEAAQFLSAALSDATDIFGRQSRDAGKIETARSVLLKEQGKLLPAIEAANRALSAVLPDFKPANARENPRLESFYEENVIFEALEAKAQAAEQMYRTDPDPAWLTLALECHDLAWQAEMRLRSVYQYSSSKLNLQQDARTREESALRVTRLMYEKTGKAIYAEKAFAITERSKATLLLDAVRDNLFRQEIAHNDARFARITTLRQSLAYFERSLLLDPANAKAPHWRIEADALGVQIAQLERNLAADYPRLTSRNKSATDVLPGAGDLAGGEVLITYFVTAGGVDVFVVRENQPLLWRRLPDTGDLTALAGYFLSFFENSAAILKEPATYLQTAYLLWQKIIPAEAANAPRLLIVPDGFLNFIPFEALVTESPAGAVSLHNAAYLIGKQEVRYAWSLAVLREQNSMPARAEEFMLAVAPGFAGGERGLAPLNTGSKEWHSAGGGGGIKERTGRDADARHFFQEAGQFSILHLASHAFSDTNPRIELYDRALLLPDIYALSLCADLVVLSACQTGLGREQKGEGVMSLTRAFAQAGAACTVSSLWSVNDRSTAQVLTHFYKNLREGKSVCKALRQAKLAYIADPDVGPGMQSPYFWAGLAPVGADRSIREHGKGLPYLTLLFGGAIAMLALVAYRYLKG